MAFRIPHAIWYSPAAEYSLQYTTRLAQKIHSNSTDSPGACGVPCASRGESKPPMWLY